MGFWQIPHHSPKGTYEPTHEIMALIALRKLNLQMRMRSNPLGLHVWFLVRPFVYCHALCVRTAKALVRLRIPPEPSLVAYAISTIISWAGSYVLQINLANSLWRSWLEGALCLNLIRDKCLSIYIAKLYQELPIQFAATCILSKKYAHGESSFTLKC